MSARIGIVGLGAIGGAVAARLVESRKPDEQFGLAAGSEEKAAALRASGFVLRRRDPARSAAELRVPAVEAAAALPAIASGAGYDWLLLCTRAEATEAALDASLPLLAKTGAVICLQNGLPEERVAKRAGRERTLGAMIAWSATSDGAGRIEITGRGGFVLGAHDPSGAIHLAGACGLLSRAFPTRLTENLAGARWGKLALNCAISTLGAISGLSFGELAANRDARALALACIGEVAFVAAARGVKLGRVSGLDPRWLADARTISFNAAADASTLSSNRPSDARLRIFRPLRHALFWIASRQRPRQRSGMLERLLAGRSSGQIDDLNGAVVDAANSLGIEAPLNRLLVERIHAIERGETEIGPHNFSELAQSLEPRARRSTRRRNDSNE